MGTQIFSSLIRDDLVERGCFLKFFDSAGIHCCTWLYVLYIQYAPHHSATAALCVTSFILRRLRSSGRLRGVLPHMILMVSHMRSFTLSLEGAAQYQVYDRSDCILTLVSMITELLEDGAVYRVF